MTISHLSPDLLAPGSCISEEDDQWLSKLSRGRALLWLCQNCLCMVYVWCFHYAKHVLHMENKYCISPNKRAGCRGQKRALTLVWFQWIKLCELVNTLALRGGNLIEIGSAVSEIWPGKVKSRGTRLFKQVCLFGEIWYWWLSPQHCSPISIIKMFFSCQTICQVAMEFLVWQLEIVVWHNTILH